MADARNVIWRNGKKWLTTVIARKISKKERYDRAVVACSNTRPKTKNKKTSP